jgi:type II secretory pathway pseudopilin PulG
MMGRCRKNTGQQSADRGFSLLEMIIACLLFTTVSISLLGVFTHHYRAIARSRSQLLAQHLARAKMTDLAASKFDGVDLLLPNPGPEKIEDIPVEYEIRDQKITMNFEVWAERTLSTTGLGGEKNIAVWVYWKEQGLTRSVVYRTLLARNG